MREYRRLLATFNLTPLDDTVASWAGLITRLAKSERVYFAHVAEKLELPPSLRAQQPDYAEPTEDVIESRLRHAALEHFNGHPETQLRYIVADGAPIIELLRRIREYNVDLVVAGKAADKPHGGSLPEKLARKAPCSVLVVREGQSPKINRILVPIDFSTLCAEAVETALILARTVRGAKIHCVHAYSTWPPAYASMGYTCEAYPDLIVRHVDEEFDQFLARFNLKGLDVDTEVVADPSPARAIRVAVDSFAPDIVVMATRGRTDAAAMVLGSVTERMIRTTSVPLLAVKRKGEGKGLLDAVLNP